MTFPTDTRLPAQASHIIDRSKSLVFSFDGQQYTACEGDTIGSALAAAGVTTLTNSLHYGRERGLLCASGNCANCMVQLGDEPNVRACVTRVRDGMVVEIQNADPAPGLDPQALPEAADELLPAGYSFKGFMQPRERWPEYERYLRGTSGYGKVDLASVPGEFDKQYLHAGVTVVGGGAAGMRAALAAADSGAKVILMETEAALGGHLRYAVHDIDGKPGYQYAAELAAQVMAHPNIEVMTGTTAFGRYDLNWIGAFSGNRLIKLRTKALVVTTGAYETPPLFENNDLPGVMLAAGARRLLHLYGVLPGKHAVVVSSNLRGLQTALDLHAAGVEIAAVAETRKVPDASLVAQLALAGIRVLLNTMVVEAKTSGGRVSSAMLQALDGSGSEEIVCDLLVLATGYMPAYELLYQAGAKMLWDEKINEFTPGTLPKNVFAAGEVTGTHELFDIEREGEWAGLEAAKALGLGVHVERARTVQNEVFDRRASRNAWSFVHVPEPEQRHEFVCLCEDITRENVRQSIEEGFTSMELLKRYSTISTGPCQGRMCGMNTMQLCAHYNGQAIAQAGTTTSRPPARPVTMGALAGRSMEPVRVTSIHEWHVQHGAKMMNAGVWKRPEHYGDPLAEVRATRNGVGLIDISTLGKFHVVGKDAAAMLEKLYVNRWAKLGVGRVRYGVMVNNEGVVMDDGVTARLSDDFYYMTATSSGATAVHEWIESFLQTGWQLDVDLLDATELRAAMNLTGPHARELLEKVCEGIELSNAAFPYMNAREGKVAGVPALLLRVGFTGELGYEIHVPSGYGLHVWQTLMDAGRQYGITPFGVEAQRIMRLEKGHLIVGQDTDGLSNPLQAGLEGLVKLDKDDFVGRQSLVFAQERGIQQRLVGFEMDELPEEGCQIVQPGSGPIGLEILGRITSTRYSPTLNKVIGLCWLPTAMSQPGQAFTVRVRGNLLPGRVVATPFYDAEGSRLNS